MKKRSLFAAVAMLIVSALVLTSATYAWFAASTTAALEQFEATITNTNGSIKISARNTAGWTNTLSVDDITTAQANSVATSLNPVSFHYDTTNQTPAWLGGQIAQVVDENTNATSQKFVTNSATKGTDYTEFTVYVKSEMAGSVLVTPTFSRDVNFVYASISSGSTCKVLAAGADSYYPLLVALPASDAQTTLTDASPENNIVGSEDTGYATYIGGSGTQPVSATTNESGTLTLTFANPGIQSIKVCMWAEGQDADCTGPVSGEAETLSLAFEYVAPQNQGG